MDERTKKSSGTTRQMQNKSTTQRTRPAQNGSNRKRRNGASRRRRKRNLAFKMSILVLIVIGIVGGAFLLKRYSPSKEKADLKKYYGIEQDNQVAVIIDNQILEAKAAMFDGKPYLEYSLVRDYLNDRFYWDSNENILLYTLPEGTIRADVGSNEYTLQKEKKSEDYTIIKTEGSTAYIALDFVRKYTNIEFKTYEDPQRVMIISDWGKIRTATVKKDTQVRYRGGVKSPYLTEVSKKDKVTVIENEGDWKKVRTEDGYIGYIKKNCLKNEKEETISREFEEQVYTNISKDYTINMAWHVVTNQSANEKVLQTIADTKGLTTISPTWFTIADTDGNINSLASSQYVNYAHQSNIEVWALVRDFDGGIGSYEESYEVLSHTSKRENLVNQLIAEALQTGIDGINVDFEKISAECGEHYIQFIRELSVKCRQNGLVLSVDNYVPKTYNAHYHIEEQGKVADYVIIMGYDEHYSGSYESGSVASLNFVKEGIEATLNAVPKEKVINAVPFFTRLWKEVPKTEEELAEEAGTEAAEYSVKVTSEALGMEAAEQAIADAGAQTTVDEATKQNYAQWEADGATYKIWLEDETALEEKLKLMKEYKLAGTAAWRLGFEKSSVWELILKYVN
ncbi:MAG: SH3 domain-containing protein [Clostridiales bacterium]|nr:SH3 domain-containing protein [Clostridiales bacterium]